MLCKALIIASESKHFVPSQERLFFLIQFCRKKQNTPSLRSGDYCAYGVLGIQCTLRSEEVPSRALGSPPNTSISGFKLTTWASGPPSPSRCAARAHCLSPPPRARPLQIEETQTDRAPQPSTGSRSEAHGNHLRKRSRRNDRVTP